jgi:hypothetical protein
VLPLAGGCLAIGFPGRLNRAPNFKIRPFAGPTNEIFVERPIVNRGVRKSNAAGIEDFCTIAQFRSRDDRIFVDQGDHVSREMERPFLKCRTT